MLESLWIGVVSPRSQPALKEGDLVEVICPTGFEARSVNRGGIVVEDETDPRAIQVQLLGSTEACPQDKRMIHSAHRIQKGSAS